MTPIENIVQADHDWTLDYLRAMSKIRAQRGEESLVNHHKAKLGRQTRTFFNGEFKFWVWETGTWTVFVSNHKGVCFEVPEASTRKIALDAWASYKDQMGL